MSTDVRTLVVDRIEGGVAVLVTDAGETVEVGRELLPRGAREGVVVQVPRGADGLYEWSRAVLDEEATRERRGEAEEILRELRKRDPGGDVAL
jgi:hypothetical protein